MLNVLERPAKKVKAAPAERNAPTIFATPKTPTPIAKTPGRLTKTPAPSSVSQAPSSVAPGTGNGRHSKANLPSELLIDGKWQRVLMPTLLLWAGGNDDVWSITRGAITVALPLVVDADPVLDSSTMDFSAQSPLVSVVSRHLTY